MSIRFKERYRPYSIEVPTICLLPNSSCRVKIFPTRMEFKDISCEKDSSGFVIIYEGHAPLDKFTVMQDLERSFVRVFGSGYKKFFSFKIKAFPSHISLFLDRAPSNGIIFNLEDDRYNLNKKDRLDIDFKFDYFPPNCVEKMHFGCHKSQDWQMVSRRKSLVEILPIWFELGKNIVDYPKNFGGTCSMLPICKELIDNKEIEKVGFSFINLFRIGFDGILSPRLKDSGYQGFICDKNCISYDASALTILGEGANLIRSLFIKEDGDNIFILPCLPIELFSGRFINIRCSGFTLSMEWSKKLIKKICIIPHVNRRLLLKFQSKIKSFRLRIDLKGDSHFFKINSYIEFSANKTYIIDRFQK